jgi:hypothetical protein
LVDLATTVLGIIGTTLIPTYLALYLVTNLKFINIRYIATAAIGLTFWYFLDTSGDSTDLGVNSGFSGGLPQAGLLIVFVLGFVALAAFDHIAVPNTKSSSNSPASSKLLVLIPVAVAAVMGIHGLGEGWDFGSAASLVSTSILNAFGGFGAVASYPIHKFLEASIVAATYSAYIGRSGITSARARWHLPVLGLLFGLPSVVGASLGYYIGLDTTYFFSFGVTAAFYAVLRLVEATNPKFKVGVNAPSYLGWKVFLVLLVGILLLYTAALFHS